MNLPQNTAYVHCSACVMLYLFLRKIELPHYYASLNHQYALKKQESVKMMFVLFFLFFSCAYLAKTINNRSKIK